jgi:hypothetical protein
MREMEDAMRDRLRMQYLSEPNFNDCRSLVNTLEECVEAVAAAPPVGVQSRVVDDKASEEKLLEEIQSLGSQLEMYKSRISKAKASLALCSNQPGNFPPFSEAAEVLYQIQSVAKESLQTS